MPRVRRTVSIRVTSNVPLAHIESDSKPGTFHVIALDESNVVWCDCVGWRHFHSCKHLKAFRATLLKAVA